MKKFLYRFILEYGRQGDIEGLFVATEKEIELILKSKLYMHDILGKHSEISGDISEEDIEKLELNPNIVSQVSKILGETWSGYNPKNYIFLKCPICNEEVHGEDFIWSSLKCEKCYSTE